MLDAARVLEGDLDAVLETLESLPAEGARARRLGQATRFFFWLVMALAVTSVIPGFSYYRGLLYPYLSPRLCVHLGLPWAWVARFLDMLVFAAMTAWAWKKLEGPVAEDPPISPWIAVWSSVALAFAGWGFGKRIFVGWLMNRLAEVGFLPFFLVLGLVDLIFLVPFLLALRELRRRCLEDWAVVDSRVETVRAYLRVLADDWAPGATLKLSFDPRSVYALDKSAERVGGMGKQGDLWLRLRGKFADGNTLDLQLSLKLSRKEKRKRKYTKIREAYEERAILLLRSAVGRWPSPADPARLRGTLLGEEGAPRLVEVDAAAGRIRLTATSGRRVRGTGRWAGDAGLGTTPLCFDAATLARMTSSAYAVLGSLRLPPKVAKRLSFERSKREQSATA